MSDDLAIYKSDWMRVLADVGLGASAISKAIELAELNGLFDPAKAALADVAATDAGTQMSDEQKKTTLYLERAKVRGIILRSQEIGGEVTQSLLMQVDHLPIVTADDMRGPAATPLRDALADMIDVYDGIATALDDSGRGWNGFRGAHLERIGTTVRKARAILRPEPAATPRGYDVAFHENQLDKLEAMKAIERGEFTDMPPLGDSRRAPAATPAPDVKLTYIKRWRTIVPLPAKYADEIAEALRPEPAATPARQTAWLVEWPEDDNVPVRWWNPATGWMRDANKALWFARESDAVDYIVASHWADSIKPTEHVFLCPVSRPEPAATPGDRQVALDSEGKPVFFAATAGWQPIETAPKDGTKVDLWHPTKGRCTDAFWQRQTSTIYDPSCWSNQWWGRIVGATHWMPLPADPSVTRPLHSPTENKG